jgi:nicotinate-nucleotide--dimethylbenzimidazole phosphoribosyltransferase
MSESFIVPELDLAAERFARDYQLTLTKPPHSLGRLEQLAMQLAAIQGVHQPSVRPAACLIFAADHPVVRHGVAPYPQAVTRAMLANFLAGGAAASSLALGNRIPLTVVDVGVLGHTESRAGQHCSLTRSSVADIAEGDILTEDALSVEGFQAAVAAGQDAVRAQGPGLKVLILGEIGIGNTTIASAVAAGLLPEVEPRVLVGAGTGADDAMKARKLGVVQAVLARIGRNNDAEEVLRRAGGRELAALYGAMQAAITGRVAVLVDGFIVTTAALALCQKYPGAEKYMIFGHESEEAGHRLVLAHLGAQPLLRLGLRLGEGSGALLAFPIVEQAAALHNQMATFAGAKVPDRT